MRIFNTFESISLSAMNIPKINNLQKEKDKMNEKKILIPFVVIGVFFWGCVDDSPISVDQHNLDEPDSTPAITESNYNDGTIHDFSEGYYNGRIRSDRAHLEWEASEDENFLGYKIYRAYSYAFEGSDISEGFEAGFPAGWNTSPPLWDIPSWSNCNLFNDEDNEGKAYDGNYSIHCGGGYNDTKYLELTIDVRKYTNIYISFYEHEDNSSGDGSLYINGVYQLGWGSDFGWTQRSTIYNTGSNSQITLQWIYSTGYYGGEAYLDNIEISGIEVDDLSYSLIETLSDKNAPSFWDTTLTQNQYYTYKVANIIKTGTHKIDDIAIKTPLWQAPNNIHYEILSPEVVEVIWDDNSESETLFIVYVEKSYYDDWNGYGWDYSNQYYSNQDDTSMVVTNLLTDTQYRLGVKAYNSWEETDTSYSGSFVITFEPPTYLNTSQVSNTEAVYLTWNDNTNIESGFKIQRKIDFNGVYETIGYSDENETYYTDYIDSETLESSFNIPFIYQVSAYNTYSDTVFSDYSSYDSYTFTTLPLPSNLSANQRDGSKLVDLTWSDNSSLESGFKIERDIGTGFEFLTIVSTNTITYTDTDTANFEYENEITYRVRAYNNSSEQENSGYSNEASVTLYEFLGLFEDFEEGDILPEDWSTSTSGGSGWSISSNYFYGGNYSIHCGTGYYDTEYLEITIDVPLNTTIDISFYQYENNSSGDGHLYINGVHQFDWDSGSSWSKQSTSYYTSSNNQITLQWRYTTATYGEVYLDNIQVSW